MRNAFKTVFVVFLLLVLVFTVNANDHRREIDSFLKIVSSNGDLNGTVLVASEGKIVYQKSFGYSDFPSRRRASTSDIYPIASITKSITSTAVLQLVSRGKLRLDDSVFAYIDGFPYRDVTIRHLLSHTSGMPSYGAFYSDQELSKVTTPVTTASFLAKISEAPKPPISIPGTKWRYDNTNYIVLSHIVEKVTGKNFEQYVDQNILRPAGMKNTRPFQGIFDRKRNRPSRLVIPHLLTPMYAEEPVRADTIEFVVDYWSKYEFDGYGEYIATADDLLKFDVALRNGKLLDLGLEEQAYTVARLNSGQNNPGEYGLGWNIWQDLQLGKSVYHTGSTIGLNCVLFRNLKRNQTVIVFNIARSNANYIAMSLLRIMNGIEPERPRKDLVRIYGRLLVEKGTRQAEKAVEPLIKNERDYRFMKESLIELGYSFLGEPNPYRLSISADVEKALHVFEFAVKTFPDYWNSYDSYADVLSRTGRKADAIKMYKRSIGLNPENESGKAALKNLLEHH